MRLFLINAVHLLIGLALFMLGIVLAATITVHPTLKNLSILGFLIAALVAAYMFTWQLVKPLYQSQNLNFWSTRISPLSVKFLIIGLVIYQIIIFLARNNW